MELYERCMDGSITEVMNAVHPRKGDSLLIRPGTVHSAGGGLLIAEIQESSDLTFRLYDQGRENDPQTARPMHLVEAFDFIDMGRYDGSDYRKGPLWDDRSHGGFREEGRQVTEELASVPQFTVSEMEVREPLKISSGHSGSFLIYVCVDGEAVIQVPSRDGHPGECRIRKGETVLVPADLQDFFIIPTERETRLLEVMMERRDQEHLAREASDRHDLDERREKLHIDHCGRERDCDGMKRQERIHCQEGSDEMAASVPHEDACPARVVHEVPGKDHQQYEIPASERRKCNRSEQDGRHRDLRGKSIKTVGYVERVHGGRDEEDCARVIHEHIRRLEGDALHDVSIECTCDQLQCQLHQAREAVSTVMDNLHDVVGKAD